MCIQLRERLDIVVGGTIEEGVVHVTTPAGSFKLVVQGFQCSGLWLAVRHIEIARHTTGCCCPALTLYVSLLRQSRLTEMHMVVYHSRQHITTRGIDDFIKRCLGLLFGNIYNVAVFDNNAAIENPTFIDDASTLDQYVHFCSGTLVSGVAGCDGMVSA